jgi:hypothetical protein
MKKSNKKKPTWTDLKSQLADLDRPVLLGLIQDLYAASKNNQVFLHARFDLGEENARLMELLIQHGIAWEEPLDALDESAPRVLLATGRLIGEGFDHPPLDTLVLAMPISWKGTLQQYAGRLHREHADKQDVRIYDYAETDQAPAQPHVGQTPARLPGTAARRP